MDGGEKGQVRVMEMSRMAQTKSQTKNINQTATEQVAGRFTAGKLGQRDGWDSVGTFMTKNILVAWP